jgi:hypothetical protein
VEQILGRGRLTTFEPDAEMPSAAANMPFQFPRTPGPQAYSIE